ncbi:MAG: leucine-rich repeat domain-containing protein [Candidatus Berkiella sp.]
MSEKIYSYDDLRKLKKVLLKEYEFFKKYKEAIFSKINSNALALSSSYKILTELVKQDLDDLDNIVKLDVELERVNCRVAMSYLNEVQEHDLSLEYLTRLPTLLFSLHLNKLMILKKLVLDGHKCKIIHVSSKIGLLTNLIELDISGCLLTQLPDAIVYLENLEILSLKHNHLSTLPDGIERLTHLKELDLSYNHEMRVLPRGVGKLKNLHKLKIDHDNLDSLPDEICDLEHLHEIQAHHNHLRQLPKALERLGQLEILDIHNNELRTLPHNITRLSALKYLNIQGNYIESVPDGFKKNRRYNNKRSSR